MRQSAVHDLACLKFAETNCQTIPFRVPMTHDVNPIHGLFTHIPAPLRQFTRHLDDYDETWTVHSLSKSSFQAHKFEALEVKASEITNNLDPQIRSLKVRV